MTRRLCADPDCDRPHYSRGLCKNCYERLRYRELAGHPARQARILIDEPVVPCPDELLPLAGQCADNDARAIVRLIWPHLLEASIAGREPFTLDEVS